MPAVTAPRSAPDDPFTAEAEEAALGLAVVVVTGAPVALPTDAWKKVAAADVTCVWVKLLEVSIYASESEGNVNHLSPLRGERRTGKTET